MTDPSPSPVAASPASREGNLEFQNTIEGVLIRTLGSKLNAELRAKLREAGLDLDKKLLPAYPAADFHRWVSIAAEYVYPGVSGSEAVRLFGRQSLVGLGETMIGKAMKLSLTLIGPRRALQRAGRSFRSNNNYIVVQSRELTPTSMELVFNEVHNLPSYYQGVLEGACMLIGAKQCTVRLDSMLGNGARFVAEWEA
ncbi:MAG: DUF2378 family protein [Deltaproteobacteria bacterium]|nr:DUF2378 family protein [Deltaproteobacteria bacterium]